MGKTRCRPERVAGLARLVLGAHTLLRAAGEACGRTRSPARAAAARRNGKLGGRPRKTAAKSAFGMKNQFWLGVAGVSVAVCSTPASPCACEPARTHLVVYGVARSSTGEGVPGVPVYATLPHLGDAIIDPVSAPGHVTTATAADGSYRVELISLEHPALPVGVSVAAIRPPADTARVATFGELRPINDIADSVRADLSFP